MRFVKPLDRAILLESAARTPRLVTVEDHVLAGGFGSAVLEALSEAQPGAQARGAVVPANGHGRREWPQVLRLGLPDRFVMHGAPAALYDSVGLSPERIARRSAEWLGVAVPAEDPAAAGLPRP